MGGSLNNLFLPNYYFRYKNHIYYHYEVSGYDGIKEGDVKFENSDPGTFEIIDNNFAKDKNNVYYNMAVVENADPKTFRPLDWPYAEDKNYIFKQSEIYKIK